MSAPPIELELHRVFLTRAGAFRVELKLDEDSWLNLDFEPESEGHLQLTDTLTRVLTRALSRIGERGVAIVGMTPAPEYVEEDE
jgi:hypothetical protein